MDDHERIKKSWKIGQTRLAKFHQLESESKDPQHPNHEQAKAELRSIIGEYIKPEDFGELPLVQKLKGQGFEIYENSRPGGPFSVILKRGDTQTSAIAPTFEEAIFKAYESFLLSLSK